MHEAGLGRLQCITHCATRDSRRRPQRQALVEGGFNGRTNKLADGCYSFWQGSLFSMLQRLPADALRHPGAVRRACTCWQRVAGCFSNLATRACCHCQSGCWLWGRALLLPRLLLTRTSPPARATRRSPWAACPPCPPCRRSWPRAPWSRRTRRWRTSRPRRSSSSAPRSRCAGVALGLASGPALPQHCSARAAAWPGHGPGVAHLNLLARCLYVRPYTTLPHARRTARCAPRRRATERMRRCRSGRAGVRRRWRAWRAACWTRQAPHSR